MIFKDSMKPRVTVIIPCYNMEYKISRMLNSLLVQTSRDFVVYVVDDGSKDKSRTVVEKYIERFKLNGIQLYYIFQENAGVSAAVNNGLKRVDTDFFCLPDADDYLDKNYMEMCIGFLTEHKDCGIVFTQCNVYYQDAIGKKVGLLQRKDCFDKSQEEIFKDFIWGRDVYYCPNYMIRTKAFQKANGDLQIESGRYGQNYQLLLPITYNSRCGYIQKPLYNYVIYKHSISHGKRSFEQRYNSIDGGTTSLLETVKKMSLDKNKEKDFTHMITQKNAIQKTEIACEYGEKEFFQKYYAQIDDKYIPKRIKSIYYRRNWPLYFKGVSSYYRIRRSLTSSLLGYRIKAILYQFFYQ